MEKAKIRSVLVDDELSNLENLHILLTNYCPSVTVVGMASSVEDAAVLITKEKPDLVFLDIEIKNSTGFDLLEQLPKRDFDVIFVTAFDQYAIKAFRFSALDYLLKPVNVLDLEEAVGRVGKRHDSGETKVGELENLMFNLRKELPTSRRIALPLSGRTEFITISDIRRCEGESSYTTFFLQKGPKMVVSRTLKEYEEMLADYNFVRVNKSNLVNMSYVKSFVKKGGAHLVMDDGTTISVSSQKRSDIFRQLMGE